MVVSMIRAQVVANGKPMVLAVNIQIILSHNPERKFTLEQVMSVNTRWVQGISRSLVLYNRLTCETSNSISWVLVNLTSCSFTFAPTADLEETAKAPMN